MTGVKRTDDMGRMEDLRGEAGQKESLKKTLR